MFCHAHTHNTHTHTWHTEHIAHNTRAQSTHTAHTARHTPRPPYPNAPCPAPGRVSACPRARVPARVPACPRARSRACVPACLHARRPQTAAPSPQPAACRTADGRPQTVNRKQQLSVGKYLLFLRDTFGLPLRNTFIYKFIVYTCVYRFTVEF